MIDVVLLPELKEQYKAISEMERGMSEEEVKEVKPQEDEFQEMTLQEMEKRYIALALNHFGGNKTKTARSLSITVKTLYNKIHSYGIVENNDVK